ncbi:hypothetical protein OURE66S_03893 [Oligella ureolytica]
MLLRVKDCSPIPSDLVKKKADWLRQVAENVKADNFVVSVTGDSSRDEEEPVVYCDWKGQWRTGRYIGSFTYGGYSLTIEPRYGMGNIRHWLRSVNSLVITETQGKSKNDHSFIIQFLAHIWNQGIQEAARHGLPFLNHNVVTQSSTIRGRLDVARSLRLIVGRQQQVISVHSEKSLDHAASRAIVAAYRVLKRCLGIPDDKWMTSRSIEIIQHLISVTGYHPVTPTKKELRQVRYTPITRGFAKIAELSHQIANNQGLSTEVGDDKVKGLLIDVAELWELYVLHVLRTASLSLDVEHGTRQKKSDYLLMSDVSNEEIGKLIPDAIIYKNGRVIGIADAKYKNIFPNNKTYGPQREDLYQMSAYLNRFSNESNDLPWGLLIYPKDSESSDISMAEANSPWRFNSDNQLFFVTLPHTEEDAVKVIKNLYKQLPSLNSFFGE